MRHLLFPKFLNSNGLPGHFALAIALATGGALVAAGVSEPAQARSSKKDKKKKKKVKYSKEFIAAYTPVKTILDSAAKGEGDLAAAKPLLAGMSAAAASPQEKLLAGNVIYSYGAKTQDQAVQFDGLSQMLASGGVLPENLGSYNFAGYQLATALGKHHEARGYLGQAIAHNYSSAKVAPDALRIAMAESYFTEKLYREGLNYLSDAIAERKKAGLDVEQRWYRRGLSVAYNNKITPEVYDFATGWIGDYPSKENWRDAINITRNLNEFAPEEMLDLMRLAFRADTLDQKYEFIDYVEAADVRKLPKEVETVIKAGYSSGRVSKDDIFLADTLKTAAGLIAADRRDLPALDKDARAPGAKPRTVMAAGDVYLSYANYAKAAEFYQKASGMAGLDNSAVMTRLGIAQTGLGQFDSAREAFAKVTGKRKPIAMLWTAYADQKAAQSIAPTAPPVAGEATDASS